MVSLHPTARHPELSASCCGSPARFLSGCGSSSLVTTQTSILEHNFTGTWRTTPSPGKARVRRKCNQRKTQDGTWYDMNTYQLRIDAQGDLGKVMTVPHKAHQDGLHTVEGMEDASHYIVHTEAGALRALFMYPPFWGLEYWHPYAALPKPYHLHNTSVRSGGHYVTH